ncbi:MAG: hypothetical protein JRM95_06365, partial [Nitrososphaerota archaeon]|nr:hypothetical protein [Nitrososphaerota archaeon]
MPPFSIWTIDIVVAVASAVLMLWAFAFYYGRAKSVASSFSVGLTLFTAIFLVQNLLAVFFYFQQSPCLAAGCSIAAIHQSQSTTAPSPFTW